jgi:outer membrane protein OmpA-like peptidoglycan-associated protein
VADTTFRASSIEIALQRWKVGTTLTLRDVRFATNSAELQATHQTELDQLVELLAPGTERIRITGHTDATGAAALNLELSERRAAAVKDYLVARGIDASRMVTAGRGAAEPVASNDTEEGRALNRRTEITVIE